MTRRRARHQRHSSIWLIGVVLAIAACTDRTSNDATAISEPATGSPTIDPATPTGPLGTGVAPATDPAAGSSANANTNTVATNVYSGATAGHLSTSAARARPLLSVPSNDNGTVAVIDQNTHQQIARYPVGAQVQHVVPSRTLDRLYANASGASQLVPFNPTTGKPGASFIAYAYAYAYARSDRLSLVEARSTAAVVLFAVAMVVLADVTRSLRRRHFAMLAALAATFVTALVVPVSRHYFEFAPPPAATWINVVTTALGAIVLLVTTGRLTARHQQPATSASVNPAHQTPKADRGPPTGTSMPASDHEPSTRPRTVFAWGTC